MSSATLTVTVTLTNGGTTRAVELQQLQRGADLAAEQVRRLGGATTTGAVYSDGGPSSPISATFTYVPVASS
jgi:hypothetical protein